MDLKISEQYLEEISDYIGRSLVGKLLKRTEILSDRNVLKQEIRELVYEEIRHLRDLILANNYGINISVFKFKSKEEK